MTLAEYLSPAQFPLTTDPARSPMDQIRWDVAQYDCYAETLLAGITLTDHDRAVADELAVKRRNVIGVLAEVREREAGEVVPDMIVSAGAVPAK
jgi:hypothetical protein